MPTAVTNSTKSKYWLLTIKHAEFNPIYLPSLFSYLKGQLERGDGGFLHYQVLGITTKQERLSAIKKVFATAHAEPSRSEAANDYVWKDETSIEGTRFELGTMPFKRNSAEDWRRILDAAKSGDFDTIPADIYIRNYRNLKAISAENAAPVGCERVCTVFHGPTGTGKSRRAWDEAGLQAYPKDPCTKFWDGYRSHKHVVIDEFRGTIGISHMLRWLDRYPVLVEIKGSSVVFSATHIWITSNLHPRDWYPTLDELTINALIRRLNIIEIL